MYYLKDSKILQLQKMYINNWNLQRQIDNEKLNIKFNRRTSFISIATSSNQIPLK